MSNDPLFGLHGQALELRSQRMSVLASNIANAATPGYKARDIDFGEALKAAQHGQDTSVATKYRTPLQASLNGNTVELSSEQTAFAENAVAYRTTLSFLNSRISTVQRALKGE